VAIHAFRAADETFYTRSHRLTLSLSAFLLAALLFPLVAPWGEPPLTLLRFAAYLFLLTLPIAALSYWASEGLARLDTRRRLRRIFAGDPWLVSPPPPNATHRLVCAALLPDRSAAGGILYVQPTQFLFQLHRITPGGEIPAPVVVEPSRSITVAPFHLTLTGLSRWLWKSPPEGIVLRWGDGHALYLRAPLASSIVPVLQALVDQMRIRDDAATAV